ncbi:MAG: thiamine-phosphate pyrophosphorylase [Rickettsiales bacterium]|jgi:thiamine-phosphate pyrophosphorylase
MTQIYLISPPKIELENFSIQLNLALKTKKVPVFQLRLKGYEDQEIVKIGKKLIEICHQNQTLFILNDRLDLALEIGANGVHLGADDGDIVKAKNDSPKNFIVGASCYDSKDLAVTAIQNGVDYVSFGTFFESSTKNSKGHPNPEILTWCDDLFGVQSVAIGGINQENCQQLIEAKADFLAVISYVWDNKNGVEFAIDQLFDCVNK